jgi:predicted SprT family Zn-dependent metalloprotease
MSKIPERILDKLDTDTLLNCYLSISKPDQIHRHFEKMTFDPSEMDQRIRIYNIYVKLMLNKCMKEKGHGGLIGWTGTTGGKLRTSGGNCSFQKKLIQIADWMIESDVTKFEDLRDTILHEIAHANTWLKHGVSGHGPKWNMEAKLIGCTGQRCLPKKYLAAVYESAIYKCRHPSDKCICVKTGSKQSLNMFSKKMPKLVCKKHKAPFDYIETKAYKPKGLSSSFGNEKQKESVHQSEQIIVVEDGDVIEVGQDGEVYSMEPDICLKYD